ncbi:MAG TPA: thiamine pyrophosphate-binding protein [Pseudonocardia sp.]|nr:thiamine pyrophosphate-binding protein [Pseudonocardia sp.]
MLVAELVGRTLARLGLARVFGVVGSGNFAVTTALRAAGVPFVATRHEAGAATAADSYARMSGLMAAVTTHQGCGFTNALTGITEAAKSRTPLLVLTADTAGAAVLSNFNVDQDNLARSVGAVPERVHSAASAVADTVRAYRTALTERRTVVLNLPLDVQGQPAPDDAVALLDRDLEPPAAPAPMRPSASAVTALADLVAAASRPVFIAGRGARHAGAPLRELAARSGALLATSAVAHGLFAGDEFALGISGGFASPVAAELIGDADLVVGWGCALNMWTTRHGKLLNPRAALVQVDLEVAALGAHRPITFGVLGDTAETAADVLAELLARGHTHSGYRRADVRGRIAAGDWRRVGYPELPGPGIDPRRLSARLDELLPTRRLVAVDSGNFMGYPSAYLSVPDEFGFCFTQAYQSIGLGLFTALGAALAHPDRLTVAALGDGGFTMGVAELETVVRLGVPMVVVIYNDAGYGAEVHHFGPDSTPEDLESVRFPDRDLAAIGRGFGAEAVTVRSVTDLDAVSDWLAAARPVPLVIDAKIADDGGAWWLAEAFGH